MEIKTSKVTKVTGNGKFSNAHGTFYSFEIDFENGDHGQANTKEQNQNKWVIGKLTAYEITPNGEFAPKLKLCKEQPTEGSNPNVVNNNSSYPIAKNEGVQRLIVAQNSMTNATNYGINAGMAYDEIKGLAKKMFNDVHEIAEGGENGSN